jgi:hypothetical protein
MRRLNYTRFTAHILMLFFPIAVTTIFKGLNCPFLLSVYIFQAITVVSDCAEPRANLGRRNILAESSNRVHNGDLPGGGDRHVRIYRKNKEDRPTSGRSASASFSAPACFFRCSVKDFGVTQSVARL